MKLAWKSGFLRFLPKIIKKIFLHDFLGAITFFRVDGFSIFLQILKIWNIIYRNLLKNPRSDNSEWNESDFKKGLPRIRGPSDENFKSLIFDPIWLKLGPVHKNITRIGNQTHFWGLGEFQSIYRGWCIFSYSLISMKNGIGLGAVISLPIMFQWVK